MLQRIRRLPEVTISLDVFIFIANYNRVLLHTVFLAQPLASTVMVLIKLGWVNSFNSSLIYSANAFTLSTSWVPEKPW